MKLEGWKAWVVLIASIIHLVSIAFTLPLAIALAFIH